MPRKKTRWLLATEPLPARKALDRLGDNIDLLADAEERIGELMKRVHREVHEILAPLGELARVIGYLHGVAVTDDAPQAALRAAPPIAPLRAPVEPNLDTWMRSARNWWVHGIEVRPLAALFATGRVDGFTGSYVVECSAGAGKTQIAWLMEQRFAELRAAEKAEKKEPD